jgi:hypothetical protein
MKKIFSVLEFEEPSLQDALGRFDKDSQQGTVLSSNNEEYII